VNEIFCNTVVSCSCFLNCLYRLVVAHHSELWQHFLAVFCVLSCWTNSTPTPSSSFFAFVREAGCMERTAIAFVGLQVCMLMFPFPSSYIWSWPFVLPVKSDTHILMIFLLLPTKILQHAQYNCIYTSEIKLRNSVRDHCLFDLVQVYSLTSLSRTSTPLLSL
jgi:hypothetical protein